MLVGTFEVQVGGRAVVAAGGRNSAGHAPLSSTKAWVQPLSNHTSRMSSTRS